MMRAAEFNDVPNTKATIRGEAHMLPDTTHVAPVAQLKRKYGDISIDGHGFTVVGDAYLNVPPYSRARTEEVIKLGLCFGSAPQLESDLFVGRDAELEKISRILRPGQPKQQRLILGGIGGIGKTQLAIAYAERYQQTYDSVFWLNATSQVTLNADLRLVAGRFIEASQLETLKDEQVLARVHEWLSKRENIRWLLIFDNYDEPTQYQINKYCPYTSHGAILVTTRLPDCVRLSSEKMHVQPLTKMQDCLDLLGKRSERENLQADKHACLLIERLSGLPLALATAGAYLNKSPSMTFQQYLEAYEERWNIDPRRPPELQEYQDRTLYTTWDMSYAHLETVDPEAAQLLKLLAYFDKQQISYALLSAGTKPRKSPSLAHSQEHVVEKDGSLSLLQQVLGDKICFEGAMRTLVRFCFIETQNATQSYSMHNCLHDWTLGHLNKTPSKQLYWYALDCVVAGIDHDLPGSLAQSKNTHLVAHAVRLAHPSFLTDELLHDLNHDQMVDVDWITLLLTAQFQLAAAERICSFVLVHREETLGPDHIDNLGAMGYLVDIYCLQNKLNKAEEMCGRALAAKRKVLGSNHISTLQTIWNFGTIFHRQGALERAAKLYELGLAKMETTLGRNDELTLDTCHSLADVYYCQGKLHEAEEMYVRALFGKDEEPEYSDFSTPITASKLGNLYHDQGRFDEAERMYTQSLSRKVDTMGLQHFSTLNTAYNFADLYYTQGKLNEAEQMCARFLSEQEIMQGQSGTWTLRIECCRATVYLEQGKSEEAERIFQQVRTVYEQGQATDDEHISMGLFRDLAILYDKHDHIEQAETTYQRALEAHKKWFTPQHPRTQRVAKKFSQFLRRQDRDGEAAELERCHLGLT